MLLFRLAYQRNDASLAAMRVASVALNLGIETRFSSTVQRAVSLNPFWDKYRHTDNGKSGSYSELLALNPSQVWFIGRFTKLDIDAAKEAKAKLVLVCLWDEIEVDDSDLLDSFDAVICPNHKTLQLLKQKLGLSNLHQIPWDPGVPLTQEPREVDENKLGVIWPLDGSQSVHQEPRFLPTIEALLKQCPGVWITITYSDLMPQPGVKELRRLYQISDGRVELVKNPSWERHQLLFGQHDLTVWPTLIENIGLVGLCSLYMGTPILAFDHPIVGEMIKDGKNGVLVPCDLKSNWLGVPYVSPDYQEFSRYLLKTVKNSAGISEMRGWTFVGLKERREVFNSRIEKILMS